MFRRKKTSERRAQQRAADARPTPTVLAAEALRADPASSLTMLENTFGRTAQITVYLRERSREARVDSSSSSTTTASSSPGDTLSRRSPFDRAYDPHMMRSRSLRTPSERRASDRKQRRRLRHRRAREQRRIYGKRDLLWACVQIGTGGDTGKSPNGCLTYAEAIESAALAFLVELARKERLAEAANEDSMGIDSTLETSLRSNTSSPSPTPTPRTERRPQTARPARSKCGTLSAADSAALSRSTSDVRKVAQLQRSRK
jgi:hypothetical protein